MKQVNQNLKIKKNKADEPIEKTEEEKTAEKIKKLEESQNANS